MVYFVGAGPGAEDLITVRGRQLLEQADMIIYAGSLVNPKLLDVKKQTCSVLNSAYMTLEEVIAAMEHAEKNGQMTVRLHTGDPSIYGAIQEQMDALSVRDIAYEICPGVSSFCAAAAALSTEYTLPGVSQSVVITRMEGRTAVPPFESVRAFAAHQATMVLFLSAGLLRELTQELLSGGYLESTPAAIVYKASWPEEKVVRGTVGTLEHMAAEHGITKTALIIVGGCLGGIVGQEYERSKLYDPLFATEYRRKSE